LAAAANRPSKCAPQAGRPAIRSPLAVCLFVAVAAAGAAGDLLTKHHVFRNALSDPSLPQRVEEILAHYGRQTSGREVLQRLGIRQPVGLGVQLTLSTNPGVVFGLSMPPWLVAAATIVTIVLVAYFFAGSPARAYLGHVGLACILGGALGNFYDRLFGRVELPGAEPIRGHVRDFIDCSAWHYPWVFNVADVLLVAGAAALLLHMLLHRRRAGG